jgi:hypothetical protein
MIPPPASASPTQILQIARERAREEVQALRANIRNLNAPQRVRLAKINTFLSPRPALAGDTIALCRLARSLKFVTGEEHIAIEKDLQ